MGIGRKQDFPPLLAPGRHTMSMPEFQMLCVSPFAENTKRIALFSTLQEFVHKLIGAKIICEVWLDGSFLTEKPDPDDLDLAVVVNQEVGSALTGEQRSLIEDIDEPEYMAGLDIFAFVRRAEDDPSYGDEYLDGAHTWHEQWGMEHSGEWLKGFVVIKIGETDVGLRICS